MPSPGVSLKRDCTSLSSENICGACKRTFSAPHILDKHQRHSCRQTSDELKQIATYARNVHVPIKRRRLDSGSLSSETITSNGHANTATQVDAVGLCHWQSNESGREQVLVPNLPQRRFDPTGPSLSCGPGVLDRDSTIASVCAAGQAMVSKTRQSNCQGEPSSRSSGRWDVSNTAVDTGSRFTTEPDLFGLKKRFHSKEPPLHDPDSSLTPEDLYDLAHHRGRPDDPVTNSTPQAKSPELTPQLSPTNPSHQSERTNLGAQASSATALPTQTAPSGPALEASPFAPFPNLSSFELGEWFYGQSGKSLRDFRALIEILTSPDFSVDDIKKTKWTRVFRDLGKNKEDLNPKYSTWIDDAGWKTTPVQIDVPIHDKMGDGSGVEQHIAGNLYHRSIVSIVQEKILNTNDSRFFHHDGFELLWQPPREGEDEADDDKPLPEFRVLSELYHSDVFLKAQKEVRESSSPGIKDCTLPRVVVGLMFWSDATQISIFSPKKLWPLYMLFGNESKHQRGKKAPDLCNHVAYFDAIGDDFKDYITARTGGKIPPDLMTHLHRECFHAQWSIILDEELLEAIIEGIVIHCSDGVRRRFFIRIFTYAADYPERVLIATIRGLGDCPCVRCLVSKRNLDQTGTPLDTAFRKDHPRVDDDERREGVRLAKESIQKGFAVKGDRVLAPLKHGGVPTANAFSDRLGSTGFDIFTTLTVDVLHEYESGVFKSFFAHLVRVVDASAAGSALLHEMDRRFRMVPTFNQTIRKFSANASKLSRRAARDYEDLLQCSIPVFDGLIPGSLNPIILKLLSCNARWHALAKLRMQTGATIGLLEEATEELGALFRDFVIATKAIETVETRHEAERRERNARKKEAEKEAKEAKKRVKEADKEAKKKAKEAQKKAEGAEKKGKGAERKTKQTGKSASHTKVASAPPTKVGAPTYRAVEPVENRVATTTGQTTTSCEHEESTSTLTPAALSCITEDDAVHRHDESWPTSVRGIPSQPTPPSSGQIPEPRSDTLAGPLDLNPQTPHPTQNGTPVTEQAKNGTRKKAKRKRVHLNISTVKFHMLGHYAPDVRMFGPTDLYSTEWGETFHQAPKAWAKHISWKQMRKELTQHERRRVRLRRVKNRILTKGGSSKLKELQEQRTAARNSELHHYIGASEQNQVWLADLSRGGRFSNDPASTNFIGDLKRHLLPRYVALIKHGVGLTAENLEVLIQGLDWSNITLRNDRLYTHKIMRVKYTTYDARRDEDIIHLETDQCNIMVHSTDYPASSAHPFRYGKVLGILHADVGYIGSIGRGQEGYIFRRLEFLWVRWYKLLAASADYDLAKVGLLPLNEPGSLGFIDPSNVLRACHIIPRFSEGRMFEDGVGKSPLTQDKNDWKEYIVNKFVDRDMFMRYEWGLAVGHIYTHRHAARANRDVIARREARNISNMRAEGTGGRANPTRQEGIDPGTVGDATTLDGIGGEGDDRVTTNGMATGVGQSEAMGTNAGGGGGEGNAGSDYQDGVENDTDCDAAEDDEDEWGSEWDEDREFAKGYESEDEREYLVFGEDRTW